MPSANRRLLLTSLGSVAVGSLAGCTGVTSDELPAGSLRFENEHELPHVIAMRVTDIGSGPGDGPGAVVGHPSVVPAQRNLSASASVEPGESKTYEGVFTEPVWYAVQFTVDGRKPHEETCATVFHPAPANEKDGTFLSGKVYDSGEFSWVVSSTENEGSF
ncbi:MULTISPECIES: hypothetical protein [Halorussus]|uniref:hypothetical protein n=1 Tax=Halorussus TaxID=1070314 RepID=UPI00209DF5E3|nr:hypothetical protein [Halorussus vallis]USZ76964.1 hypothetical protein NGM07_06440 [Halorussus vallis]